MSAISDKALEIGQKHLIACSKELAVEMLVPKLEELKADVLSKKIDLMPGTEIENELLGKLLDSVIAQVKAAV